MSRSYEDDVEVRGDDPGAGRFRPRQFVWHGRLYLVRDVLSHWYERRAWWEDAPARAVHGESPAGAEWPAGDDTTRASSPGGGSAAAGQDVAGPEAAGPRAAGTVAAGWTAGVEREVWRVEASAGRAATPGIYDLCAVLPGPRRQTSWRLQRVVD